MKKMWFCILFLFTLFFCLDKVDAMSSGTYKIVSALDENKVLTSAEDGNIQINNDSDNDNQLWDIILQSDGSFLISSKSDNTKSFDVVFANSANGTNIRLYDTNKSNAQKWNFKSSSDGFYYIQSKLNNYSVLDVANANIEEDTNIQLYGINYSNAQKFKFVEVISKDKVIDDGTYIINSKLNSEKVISLEKEASNGVNVHLNHGNSSYIDAFNLKYLDDGYYEIYPYGHEDLVLNVDGERGSNGANIQINGKSDGTSKWIIKDNFDGTYSIISNLDNYYIDIASGSIANGTNIQLFQGNGTNAQKFIFTKVDFTKIEDNVYNIVSNNSNLLLSLNNVVAYSGGNIELREKNDENNQKWEIKNIKENIYEISSVIDKNYLFDVDSGSYNNGANVQIYQSNGTDTQRWRILKLVDGSYRFTNVRSGKNLDIRNSKFSNGNNIWQYANNDTKAQKFYLNKTNINDYKKIIEEGTYLIYSALNLNKSVNFNYNIFINSVAGMQNEFLTINYVGNGFYTLKNNNKAITTNGDKVTMEKYTGSNIQLWYIVKNGDYHTFISKINGKALDVINGSSSNNTKLQTYIVNNTKAQNFYLEAAVDKKIDNGYYTISVDNNYLSINEQVPYNGNKVLVKKDNSNFSWFIKNVGNNLYEIKHSYNQNKVLDVKNGSAVDGNDIWLYGSNSTDAQRWHIICLKDGTYKFVSAKSHTNLTVINDSVKIYSHGFDKKQKFNISKTDSISYGKIIEDGYYTINSSLKSNKVLDIEGGKIASGTNVQLFSFNNTLAQIWRFKYLDNGLYSITSAMNPKRALTNFNDNVIVSKYNGGDNQKWYILGLENGNFSIISATDGLYVDVVFADVSDGTNIDVYRSNDTLAQKFDLNVYKGKKTYRGIDISKWQGSIDWKLLVRENPQFIIMRVGRGLGDLGKDVRFEEYYKNAMNYDIPVGVYIYSFATNLQEAKREAEYVIEWLDGKELDLPVFYDMEYSGQLYLGREVLTEVAETFCSTIMVNNYHCGVYANIYWLNNFLDGKKLSNKYPIWLAHWTGANDYNTVLNNFEKFQSSYTLAPYKYWQFSSLGKYPGITENTVDLDFGYDIFD